MIKNTVFLSIGSNLNPTQNIKNCLSTLKSSFSSLQQSAIYQSPSYGFDGNDFLNLVVKIETAFGIHSLKKWLNQIEDLNGRDRSKPRYSNRTLDIDILLFNDWVYSENKIKIPRPEILTQIYVLKPLVDLAPEFIHPQTQDSLQSHLKSLDPRQKITKVDI